MTILALTLIDSYTLLFELVRFLLFIVSFLIVYYKFDFRLKTEENERKRTEKILQKIQLDLEWLKSKRHID